MSTTIYYSDITKLGKDYTGKKDISILTNEQSLVESVKNILLTEPGESIMKPTFGCSLSKYLFEPIDIITSVGIRKTIIDSIRAFEPRVNNLEVNITPQEDLNTYLIDVIFDMKVFSNTTQTLKLSLNKIR